MDIERQKKIASAIMEQEFAAQGHKPEYLLRILELARKAGVPHQVALDFVELSPKRDDVAFAIVQQMFLGQTMGPNFVQKIIDLAKKAGFSYQDARDFSDSIISAKIAETMRAM